MDLRKVYREEIVGKPGRLFVHSSNMDLHLGYIHFNLPPRQKEYVLSAEQLLDRRDANAATFCAPTTKLPTAVS